MSLPVMVPGLDRDLILEWSRRIDADFYSSLAAGERITFPNPEVMVTMSAAAAVTERVQLAFSVLVLPLHSEVLIAKQVATLDLLSGGRVSLGVGVGGREEDYRAVGARFDLRRVSRMERQVEIMRRAWAGEQVVEGALRPVEPRPLQEGGPELLAGAILPRSICRAARWADGIADFSFGPSIEEIGGRFERAREAWKQEGRDTPPRLVAGFWFALGAGARNQLDVYLRRYLNLMEPSVTERIIPSVNATSAQALRELAARIQDLGADELVLAPTTSDPDEVYRVAEILG
jgi:alkanesulfonate monooxygenase SsuD/methylene tetrahydromethanopterin reductase-like flavin-dependent oxidoreductase (luciferase family)